MPIRRLHDERLDETLPSRLVEGATAVLLAESGDDGVALDGAIVSAHPACELHARAVGLRWGGSLDSDDYVAHFSIRA